MHFRVLSFDLDGTLVDTAGEIAEAANRAIEEFGVPRRPVAEITRYIGAGTRELMNKVVAQILRERPLRAAQWPMEEVMGRFDHHYELTAGSTGKPYPGCDQALEALRSAGVRLTCVTNKEARFARKVLEATRLDRHFELLIGGDTLPHKKPDRAVIEHMLHALGARAEETAHVGDSRTDVQTARNAGVKAWAVPYGYNAGEPIEAAQPDRVFRDIAEVAAYVLNEGPSADRPAPLNECAAVGR